MAARLFLDERNLAQLGFTQPNILTLRALTEFLNVRNTVTTVVQPIGDLTTTGLLSRVGDNLWATRTIVGTTDHIDVADGDGVAANPTLSLPDSGVTAGDYGDASNYVILTVDAQGRITDAQEVALPTGSGLLDTIGSTRGSILYRGASGWAALTPGTNGQFLETLGAGADPAWGTPSGGGGAASAIGTPIFSGTANPAVNNYVMVMLVADSAFTINKVAFEMTAAVATTKFQAFVYASNAAGTPGSLLASSSQVTGATAGYNEIALTSGATLAKGDLFWIGVNVTTASLNGLRCRPGGLAAFAANGSSTVPAATAPAITTFTTANAIYGFWGVA